MKSSDLWQTPSTLFNQLNDEFHFDYDVCTNGTDAKAPYIKGDYFTIPYTDCVCFMNPPYSNPAPFVERALTLIDNGVKTVCLLKSDTGTKLFHILYNDPRVELRFLKGRLRYVHPDPTKNRGWTGTFPSLIAIIGK